MNSFDALVDAHVPHREAARLTGVSRATAARRHTTTEPAQLPTRAARATPGNKLTAAERDEVLHVLNCDRFVDQTPLQIYPTLLEEGRYLCSVSTMYRVLNENAQVKDRRRQARHPPRAVPELQATGTRAGVYLGYHQTGRPGEGAVLRRLRDDRHLFPHDRRRPRAPQRIRCARGGDDEADLQDPRQPAGGARRPRHLDDQQTGLGPTRRPADHPIPFPPKGLQATTPSARRGSKR